MKAYLVLDLAINDFASFKSYIERIPTFIAKHGGRYIVQGVVPTPVEGDWRPERMVILEFPVAPERDGLPRRSRDPASVRGPAPDHDEPVGAGRRVRGVKA